MDLSSNVEFQSIKADLRGVYQRMNELGFLMGLPLDSFDERNIRYTIEPDTSNIDDDLFDMITEELMITLKQLNNRVDKFVLDNGIVEDEL